MSKKGFISCDFGGTVQLLPHPHDTFGENETGRNVRFTLVDNPTGSQCPECLSLVRFYVHKPQMSQIPGDVTVSRKRPSGRLRPAQGPPKGVQGQFPAFSPRSLGLNERLLLNGVPTKWSKSGSFRLDQNTEHCTWHGLSCDVPATHIVTVMTHPCHSRVTASRF